VTVDGTAAHLHPWLGPPHVDTDGMNPLKHRILRKIKSLEARIFVLVVT